MGTISVSLPSDGQTADAADYNVPINTIVTAINGNLDTNNIAAAAGITAAQLNFGGSGSGVWWQEIGRTTLSGAGDTISVTNLTAKKYLRVYVSVFTSGAIDMLVRFNNDSAGNYTRRYSANNGADTTATAQTSIVLTTSEASDQFSSFDVINISTKEKVVSGFAISNATAGTGSAPTRWDSTGKWVNTAAQITRIDIVNDQAGDFGIGSECVVLGHD